MISAIDSRLYEAGESTCWIDIAFHIKCTTKDDELPLQHDSEIF